MRSWSKWIRRVLAVLALAWTAVSGIAALLATHHHARSVLAQLVELSCPAGTGQLETLRNQTTGAIRNWLCVDPSGNVYFNGSLFYSGDALFRSGRPWYDVMAFGAKNDGATDDTAAIQAAIAAANANGGGIVYFPPATTANKFYKVASTCASSPFVISGNSVEIRGAAWYGSFSGAVNLPSQIFAGSCNGDLFSLNSGVQGFSLDGLQLTGPCGAPPCASFPNSRAINLGVSPQTAYIHDNSILDWGLSAIFSAGGSTVVVYNNFCINDLFARPNVDTGVLDLASTDSQVFLGYYSASVPTGAGNLGNGHSYGAVIRGGNSHITSAQFEQSMHGLLLTSGGSFTVVTGTRATTNQGNGFVINSIGNVIAGNKLLSNGLNATNTLDGIVVTTGNNIFTGNVCNNSGGFGNLQRHCINDSNSSGTAQANENQYSNNRADSTGIAGALYNMTGTAPYRVDHPIYASADRGDANITIQPWIDAEDQYFNTPLTVNRTVTITATGAWRGHRFRIIRTPAATGASTLTACGKALAAGQFVDCEFIAGSYVESAFGAL